MQRHRLARLLLVPLLLLLAACAAPAQTTGTRTLAGLPAFSDWRVAYVDQSARLHVVTEDGKRDTMGPALPWYAPTAGAGQVSAISPDGHTLAYVSSNQYYVLDLTGKRRLFAPPVPIAYDLAWSPDSSLLAVSDREKVPVLYRPADGQLLHIPSTLDRAAGLGLLRGWIDNQHLAYDIYPPDPSGGNSTTLQLASLDIATGQVRVIATFPTSRLGAADFLLSPDGRQALLYNRQFRSDPYTPEMDLIDTASGQVIRLPNLAQMVGATCGLTNLVWQPGSDIVAVAATGYYAVAHTHPWLLDVADDTSTIPFVTGFPMAWMPQQGPLILSTGDQSQVNSGATSLVAARCAADGQCTATPLTDGAWHYPFLGLVRTA
jgi:hypothetical protein